MRAARIGLVALAGLAFLLSPAASREEKPAPRAFVDGTGPGWKTLGEDDFENVNCDKDTWTWKKDGSVHCTGKPTGVIKSKKVLTNLELVLEWKHEKHAGNSGVFVWTPAASLAKLKPGGLPSGIEVQILDHGYATDYEKRTKKKPDWFTTNGDVFSVGASKLKAFAPASKDGRRSFPRKETTKGVNEWNHYYVRAINGEVRLWVNGQEVSGGTGCEPRTGYLCLESEGSPIEFRGLKIRELP